MSNETSQPKSIEAKLDAITLKLNNYTETHSEGARDNYNPFEEEFEKLAAEFLEEKNAEKELEWTIEITKERRAWVNAQGFSGRRAAARGCERKGFDLDDLHFGVRLHNL